MSLEKTIDAELLLLRNLATAYGHCRQLSLGVSPSSLSTMSAEQYLLELDTYMHAWVAHIQKNGDVYK